jgi:hypothetical protein
MSLVTKPLNYKDKMNWLGTQSWANRAPRQFPAYRGNNWGFLAFLHFPDKSGQQ